MKRNTEQALRVESASINVFDQEDIDKYCRLFGCTELDLRWAVSCVGNSTISVDAFLSMNQRKSYK